MIISHLSPKLLRLFQLRETKNILILVLSDHRGLANTAGEQISHKMVLKQVHHKLNEDTTAEVKYFMSAVVKKPVSKAIVESWGSVIYVVLRNMVVFKELDSSHAVDVTKKFLFTKPIGPSAEVI